MIKKIKHFFRGINGFIRIIALLLVLVETSIRIHQNNWDLLSFISLIGSAVLISYIMPINDWVYRRIAKGETDIDLESYLIPEEEEKIREKLEELNKLWFKNGRLLVMSSVERISYSLSIIIFTVGITMVVLKFYSEDVTSIVNGLTIAAFGLALYSLMDSQAKERLRNTINKLELALRDKVSSKQREVINVNKVNDNLKTNDEVVEETTTKSSLSGLIIIGVVVTVPFLLRSIKSKLGIK